MKKEMKNVIAVLLNASVAVSLGVFLAACGDDSGSNSNTAESGMESCTVTKNADSTSYVLKCPDGTEVEIQDGKNGENGAAGKNGNDGKNGENGQNGQNGSEGTTTPGAGCTLKELEGGSVSLECPDGTKLVFGEDGKVVGKDGSSSSVASAGSSETSQSAGSQSSVSSSSSSATPTGKTQGYVQFNRDSYTTMTDVAQAGIYLYDADNTAKTVTVTVYADSPDTLSITLNRYDRYFYGKLPLAVYGDDFDKGLFVGVGGKGKLLVEYRDLSTGVTKYDSASVDVTGDTYYTNPERSVSFGKSTYYDLDDKAVIILRDSRLTDAVSVTVHVKSEVDEGRDIPLYHVEGGDGTEYIGFVGFTLGEPYDGVVKVEDEKLFGVSYDGIRGTAWWEMTEYFGLICSMDGNLIDGIKYPDKQYVCDGGAFRLASEKEITLGKGCTSYNRMEKISGQTCVNVWYAESIAQNMSLFVDTRDGQDYAAVKIGTQTWMAENLNYATENSNCTKYGCLYTLTTAITACPLGYHLPSMDEWKVLFSAVGGESSVSRLMGEAYGFSAMPTGEAYADFWSSTSNRVSFSIYRSYVEHPSSSQQQKYNVRCLKD